MVSLASASEALKVWKFENSELQLTSRFEGFSNTGNCTCLAWNHTNQVVAAGGSDSKIYLVQANNGQILSSLQISEDDLNASSVAFSSNSRYLATSLNSDLQLWDLKRRQLKSVMTDHRGQITSTSFLPTGEIISGDLAGAVRIWDSKAFLSSPELLVPSISAPTVGVTSVGYSIASASFFSAGYTDGSLGVWDAATYKLVRRQQCHTGVLNALAYSPRNPRLVATAGSDGRVTLIDTGSKNSSSDPSAVIELAERVNITTIAFHEDAIHTAVGLSNGKVLLYDWRSIKRPVVNISAHDARSVLALAFQVFVFLIVFLRAHVVSNKFNS